jgi:L-fucose isomerase-like protein
MSKITVRLGFVPSFRFRYTEWVQKLRDESLAVFKTIPGLDVVVPEPCQDGVSIDADRGLTPHGMVQNLDQGEAVAQYFVNQHVDGLILCPLDFGDERSAVKIAEKVGVPVFLYATKEPPAYTDAPLGRVSDSYCGNLSMASGLYRRKIPFFFGGIFFPEEPELKATLTSFVRAVAVVKGLKNARIGQVGVRPETFETVGYDEIAMVKKFKQNVIFKDLSQIVLQAQQFSDDDPRLEKIVHAMRRDVPVISVADDYLVKEARIEAALVEFWQNAKLSAMAMSCWPAIQALYNFSTCSLFGRLTGQGMLTACETDILGALSMQVNYQAALGEQVPHFVDWTIQHRENENLLLAWHCGNAPTSLARDPATVALRSRNDMLGELPVIAGDSQAGLFQFQLKAGEVTFCRLAEYDDQWKMLITKGEIIPSDEILAGTWAWVEVKDHARLYRTLVEEGFIHHASMIHGNQVDALKLACKFLDVQPVIVD